MQQVKHLWTALSPRRRIIALGAAAVMFWAVLALARMASSPDMSMLYSGLENSAAGEVVAALEQRGAAYEIRGNAIFVAASQRDALRMTLASEGLPSSSSKGYELLDGLSGFGTTSQMFDAAYWRAKEGELARTIVSHPSITSARVHIAASGSRPFMRNPHQSASVSIVARGGALDAKHARALQFLVASAVAGLEPGDVAIIDSNGRLIDGMEPPKASGATDRAEQLRQRATRLLEARVGPGNAVVEIALETVTRSESIRERRFDPETRVAISTDTEERENTSTGDGGDVTVASNLPDGDAAQPQASASENSESRERVNYEVSSTEREITLLPGATKRMTVAILVNGLASETAAEFEPRPEEELTALRELVASAVGFDQERGDRITIRSLRFEPLVVPGEDVREGVLQRLQIDPMTLVQSLVLAFVSLVLGLFVLRPILTRPDAARLAELPATVSVPQQAIETREYLSGEIDDGEIDESGLSDVSGPAVDDSPNALMAPLPDTSGDPVARFRTLIGQRQEETVEILRSWLEGEDKEKV